MIPRWSPRCAARTGWGGCWWWCLGCRGTTQRSSPFGSVSPRSKSFPLISLAGEKFLQQVRVSLRALDLFQFLTGRCTTAEHF